MLQQLVKVLADEIVFGESTFWMDGLLSEQISKSGSCYSLDGINTDNAGTVVNRLPLMNKYVFQKK